MSVDEKYPLALPAGTVLAGQYTVNKVLGQGGFGITYQATDYKTGGKVAVKEFFPDTLAYREMTKVISYPGERTENYEYGKEGFLQEAKTLAEFIGCENIVRIHSYFEENGTAYFVMEYIEGISFDQYLKEKGGKISCSDAKRILIPVMDALAIVHSKGIVHRDVTPDNIYITNDGTVKLLDFGAARYSLGDKSRSLDVILKHGFAPKEQYTRRGKQGPFTDVYSLGATFYFALTGRRPPDSVDRLEEDDLIPPSSLGVQITEYEEEAIIKALSVQPAERYQSMIEFKNTFLNLETLLQASMSAQQIPVVQQVFTAPSQQPAYSTRTQIGYTSSESFVPQQPQTDHAANIGAYTQTQAIKTSKEFVSLNEETSNAAASIPNKLKKKRIITVTIAIAACVIVAIAIPGIINSSKKDDIAVSNESEFTDVAPVTTTEPLETSYEEQNEVTEATQVTTMETTDTSSSDRGIIKGNSVGNIANYGILLSNNKYWIDNSRHSIKFFNSDGTTEDLFTSENGVFSNLSMIDNDLFFLFDNSAYVYNTSSNAENAIPELEKYSGYIICLYVSDDYYFISAAIDDDYRLYRVSRKNGEEEQSISIRNGYTITFLNDSLYYYVFSDTDSSCDIYRVSATDFNDVRGQYHYQNEWVFDMVADDNYIYALCDNGEKTIIDKLSGDLTILYDCFNITDICKKYGGYDYGTSNLNVIDDNLFLSILPFNEDDTNYGKPGLYHIWYNEDRKLMDQEISPLGSGTWGGCVIKGNGYYEIDYYIQGSASLKCRKIDMNGNLID